MSERVDRPYPRLSEAMRRGDIDEVQRLFKSHPEMLKFEVPGFSTWLHYSAGHAPVAVVKFLREIGFDINALGLDGETPLVHAISFGNFDNTQFLLNCGSSLDLSAPLTNPFFAAVQGKSVEVARLLLDHGIDASVRYTEGWNNMDALGFASMWGEMEIAEMIADHLAGGDAEKKRKLLEQGRATAKANVDPLPPHGHCPDLGEED